MKNYLLDLLPKVLLAKKNDMGILRNLLISFQCDTPANYGYTQSSKRLEFQVGANNAENFNDSFIKLTFEVENYRDHRICIYRWKN